MGQENMYKLHYGTQAQYDAKKTAGTLVANDLYFTSDTCLIFKGDKQLSTAVEAVTDFPQTGVQGRIYVKASTLEAKVWNGSAWVEVSPAVETTLDADTASGVLVTAGAIKAYIEEQIGSSGVVADLSYSSANQTLTVEYADENTADKTISLTGLLTGVSYNGTTGDFTFTQANGQNIVVNTPVENFLSAASYDQATHTLTLTLEDGTDVEVDLGDLIDTYIGDETTTAAVSVNNGTITANVKISQRPGNILTIYEPEQGEAANYGGLYISTADISADVAAIQADLGHASDDSDPQNPVAATGLHADVEQNAADIAQNASDIAALEADLGTASEGATPATGLHADVEQNAADIDALEADLGHASDDSDPQNPVAATGLHADVEANAAAIADLEDDLDDNYYTKDEVDALLSWQSI